jgi:hypothetical protein
MAKKKKVFDNDPSPPTPPPSPPIPPIEDIENFRTDFLTWLQKILNNDVDDMIIDKNTAMQVYTIINTWDSNKFKKTTIFKMKFCYGTNYANNDDNYYLYNGALNLDDSSTWTCENMFANKGPTIQSVTVGACQGCSWNFIKPLSETKCLRWPDIFGENNAWYQSLSDSEKNYWDNYFTVGISIDTSKSSPPPSPSQDIPNNCWETNRGYKGPSGGSGDHTKNTCGNNVQYIEIGLNPSSVILNILNKFESLNPFSAGQDSQEWTVKTSENENLTGTNDCHSPYFSTYSECYLGLIKDCCNPDKSDVCQMVSKPLFRPIKDYLDKKNIISPTLFLIANDYPIGAQNIINSIAVGGETVVPYIYNNTFGAMIVFSDRFSKSSDDNSECYWSPATIEEGGKVDFTKMWILQGVPIQDPKEGGLPDKIYENSWARLEMDLKNYHFFPEDVNPEILSIFYYTFKKGEYIKKCCSKSYTNTSTCAEEPNNCPTSVNPTDKTYPKNRTYNFQSSCNFTGLTSNLEQIGGNKCQLLMENLCKNTPDDIYCGCYNNILHDDTVIPASCTNGLCLSKNSMKLPNAGFDLCPNLCLSKINPVVNEYNTIDINNVNINQTCKIQKNSTYNPDISDKYYECSEDDICVETTDKTGYKNDPTCGNKCSSVKYSIVNNGLGLQCLPTLINGKYNDLVSCQNDLLQIPSPPPSLVPPPPKSPPSPPSPPDSGGHNKIIVYIVIGIISIFLFIILVYLYKKMKTI